MSVLEGSPGRLPRARMLLVAFSLLLIVGANPLRAMWSGDLRLTNDAAVSGTCVNNGWATASDPLGRIHVVWQDYRNGGISQVFYKLFVPGVGWSADSQLTTTGREDIYPSAACDAAGNLYVVWQGRDVSNNRQVMFRRRDISSGWLTAEQLTSGTYQRYCPVVAAGRGDTVHAVWFGYDASSPSVYQVFYCRRTTSGWGATIALNPSANQQQYASIATDRNGGVYTVWRTHVGGVDQIFYRRYSGGAWATPNVSPIRRPPNFRRR